MPTAPYTDVEPFSSLICDLRVTCVPEDHPHFHYPYVVTRQGLSFCAFNTRNGLLGWMNDFNLKLDDAPFGLKNGGVSRPAHDVIPRDCKGETFKIEGCYRKVSHWNYNEFFALTGKDHAFSNGRTRAKVESDKLVKTMPILDNGVYTLGALLIADDGVREIHYLNCNRNFRPVLDYVESRNLVS